MVPQASIYLCENTQADPEQYDDWNSSSYAMAAKARYRVHGNRLIRAGRMLPKRMV